MAVVAGVGMGIGWFAAKWFARAFEVAVVAGCSRRAVVAIRTGRKVDRIRLALLFKQKMHYENDIDVGIF